MALAQKKMREIVLQLLFSSDFEDVDSKASIAMMMKELRVTKKSVVAAMARVQEVRGKLDEIDEVLTEASQSYDFDRVQRAERSVLRLGVYELLYDDAIPPKVAIAEAIRLTRKFSTDEAANFVNAVLDHIHKSKTEA